MVSTQCDLNNQIQKCSVQVIVGPIFDSNVFLEVNLRQFCYFVSNAIYFN